MRGLILIALLLVAAACSAGMRRDDERVAYLKAIRRRLAPLHVKLGKPKPRDWLHAHKETGHIFGMKHCTVYDCGMCGSNNREESDRRPAWLCPECVAKVGWGFGEDPAARFEALRAFYAKHGFKREAAFMQTSLDALK